MAAPQKPTKRINIFGASILAPQTLGIGHSFFVPALKPKAALSCITNAYTRQGYKFTYEERIEMGVLGIRVWRVL